MALVDLSKLSFTAGEISPLAAARTDIDRFKHAAAQLENWRVLTQGGVTRRPGLRYVATAKYADRLTLVKAFEPSTTDAYILEVGHEYLRVFKHGAWLGVEVATPYQESELRLLRTAQANDVMLLVHPNHAPRRLSRLSDTLWLLTLITFDPPPTYEAGLVGPVDLTLNGVAGTITLTAASAVFLAADVQRQLVAGVGRALVTAVASATSATAIVRDTFTTTSWVAGSWALRGSPVATLSMDRTGPVGAQIILTLGAQQDAAAELIENGDFATDLTDWTDSSAAVIVAGTATGGSDTTAIDTAGTFLTSGVRAGYRALNTTDTTEDQITGVLSEELLTTSAGGVTWAAGKAYSIEATGAAVWVGGAAQLNGGRQGVGSLSQSVTVTPGKYRLAFDVGAQPLALRVGSTSDFADILAELTYDPQVGHAVILETPGTVLIVEFRNNQDSVAMLDNVSLKRYTIEGFRLADAGQYLRVHNGLVRITSWTDATRVVGEIVQELSTDDDAPAGAWSLETPSWSDTLGWPSAVVLYEGRLYFAGSTQFPQTLWGSAIDDFFNFAPGANDADAVTLSIVDSGGNITLNRIRWLMPAENMLVGTTHGEYRLIGSGDDPITPRLIPRARLQSTYGSDTVQPLKVGAALLFAQRQGSKVREMVFDADTNTTFVARDITVLSEHLLRTDRLLELAYQQEPLSTVWGVRSDGQVPALTYDLSEQVVGWWRLVTEGEVLSVATIPHPTANAHQVWMVVQRALGTFIEYLDPETEMVLPAPVSVHNPLTDEDELITEWRGLTVDAGVVYSGAPTTTIPCAHLAGATVQIVGDGAVFPEQVVTGGQVTLSQEVSTAFVGLGFVARGRTLPVDAPVRGNTGQTARKRWVSVMGRLFESLCLILKGERIPFRTPSMPQGQGVGPRSGDVLITPLGWDRQGGVSFIADQPLPSTIVALYGTLDVEAEAQETQRAAPSTGRAR